MPTDEEIVEALRGRFETSCRAIKRIRITHGLRRRERTVNFKTPDDLVAAVLLRVADPMNMPKDDELAEEMNRDGFSTCTKEILSIRLKNKIRHPCRGTNRQGKRRRITQEPQSEAPETESDEDEILPPPPPKLVQDHHMTVVDLDREAANLLRQIIQPAKKMTMERVRPGVRVCKDLRKATEMARPLLDNLMAGEVKVTVVYISNN